jgi:GTP-binding protein
LFVLENGGRLYTKASAPRASRAVRSGSFVSTPIFLKSAAQPADFPDDEGREVAFVGRSNSGKSTAINLIAGVRKLARVSKTPGRTQLINFFEVATQRRLVDLPGYGFARVAHGTRDQWRRLIEAYVTSRRSLVGVIVTVDIRRGLTSLDADLLDWLEALELPVALLLTKSDKVAHGAGVAREREVRARLGASGKVVRFSSLTRAGVAEARAWLDAWLGTRPPPSA